MQRADLVWTARAPGASAGADDYDYLVLSDVHLGSDLVPHLRPWARDSWLSKDAEVDERLCGLLDHHLKHAARRTCLVIAGDFLDLVGVSLSPDARTTYTRLTSEEQRHGLGSAADHVVQKVAAIAERHRRVFAALCAFIAAGHKLVVVRGNHDIELHWRAAQSALSHAICQHAESPEHGASVASRIEVCPWFYAVDGLLYVEHGHEFDAMCSYGDPLLPTCPRDSRRIRLSPFSVLLREVARPTRGLSTTSYENVGLGAYMQLLANLGILGSARIAVRFARAVARLVGESRSYARGDRPLRKLRGSARERRFMQQMGLSADKLSLLKRLYVAPAARSVLFVLRSLYLDRVFTVALALLFVALGASLARYRNLLEGALFALPALPLAAFGCFGPNRDLAPTERMRQGAAEIAKLFNARYVVMGHTHDAEEQLLPNGARYLNVGHWGRDDVPEEQPSTLPQTPCTFLLLSRHQHGYRHQLLRWDTTRGALPFCAERPAATLLQTGATPVQSL